MASQVLSGASNASYTNNTGQNVRVVINYMEGDPVTQKLTINWAGLSVSADSKVSNLAPIIGRNLAFSASSSNVANNMANTQGTQSAAISALPTELMLAPNQTFSAICKIFNIIIIPEGGV